MYLLYMDSTDSNYNEPSQEELTFKYQNDFLDFFELTEYDSEVIKERVSIYYEAFKDHNTLKSTITHLANSHFLSTDDELGFYVLFSEDYFYDFTPILREYSDDNIINEQAIEALCAKIKNE